MTNLKKTLIAIIFASTTMSAYAQTNKETADAKKATARNFKIKQTN